MTRKPGSPRSTSSATLVARAQERVESLAPSADLLADESLLLVDLRDIRETMART